MNGHDQLSLDRAINLGVFRTLLAKAVIMRSPLSRRKYFVLPAVWVIEKSVSIAILLNASLAMREVPQLFPCKHGHSYGTL